MSSDCISCDAFFMRQDKFVSHDFIFLLRILLSLTKVNLFFSLKHLFERMWN